MADDEQRRRWRKYSRIHAHIAAVRAAQSYRHPSPPYPAMPDDLAQLACGAKTRAGTPCKLTSLYTCGRCKLHGGMSTGPKSEAGRRQAAENGKNGGRPRGENPTP